MSHTRPGPTVPDAAKYLLRRWLTAWLDHRLRHRASAVVGLPARRLLIIAPHQDDCALGCGGLLARAASVGAEAHIAYLTDGAASHPGHPVHAPAAIATLRAREAAAAAARLGLPQGSLHFLGAPDGMLPRLSVSEREEVTARIRRLLDTLQPELVLTPWRRDGSSEHEAAWSILQEALPSDPERRPRQWEYLVWARWSPRLLRRTLCEGPKIHRLLLSTEESTRKRAALAEYRSQFLPLPPSTTAALPPGFASPFSTGEEFHLEY